MPENPPQTELAQCGTGCARSTDDGKLRVTSKMDLEALPGRVEVIERKLDALSLSVDARFDEVDRHFDEVQQQFIEQRQYTEFVFARLDDRMQRFERKLDQVIDLVTAYPSRAPRNRKKR